MKKIFKKKNDANNKDMKVSKLRLDQVEETVEVSNNCPYDEKNKSGIIMSHYKKNFQKKDHINLETRNEYG